MKVSYVSPALDYSGYGECSRHDIAALVSAGLEVTTQIPSYVNEVSDYGRLGALVKSLENRDIGYNVRIIHVTPDQCPRFVEAGKYNIARVFWETDKIPVEFVEGLREIDEIWTGSQVNAQAIKKAGVNKPIYIIPEAISLEVEELEPYKTPAEGYRFYSIFEWSERKNPKGLLEAYWKEFGEKDNVSLVIKTYNEGFQQHHKDVISQDIRKLKDKLKLSYYAPVYVYRELMDRLQVYRFHTTFDCFVSAHRGEGWGIPQVEAMLLGKPVITTDFGGVHEYLTHKDTALLVQNVLMRVQGDRRWYDSDQNWANPSLEDLQANLRYAYSQRKRTAKIAAAGHQFVIDNFSLETVGKKMRERLEAI